MNLFIQIIESRQHGAFIRSETGGNNIKYDKLNTSNTDMECNKNVNAENFNNYFSKIAENISCRITGSHKQIINCAKYSLPYLSQAFNLSFTNTVFHNTATGEIEKVIHSFPWKNPCGYDEISMRILKISASFSSSPLCRIINTSIYTPVFSQQE